LLPRSSLFHCRKSPEISWGEVWTVWRMFWWGSTDLGERIHCNLQKGLVYNDRNSNSDDD
jgi:hypothetical protein